MSGSDEERDRGRRGSGSGQDSSHRRGQHGGRPESGGQPRRDQDERGQRSGGNREGQNRAGGSGRRESGKPRRQDQGGVGRRDDRPARDKNDRGDSRGGRDDRRSAHRDARSGSDKREDRPRPQGRPDSGSRNDSRGTDAKREKPRSGGRDYRNDRNRGDRRDDGPRRDDRNKSDRRGRATGKFDDKRGQQAPHGGKKPRSGGHKRDDAAPKRTQAPELPEDIETSELDGEVLRELRTLPKALADMVASHLIAAGRFIEEEPHKALEHARYARAKASRVASVREANGIAAYQAAEWSEALSELRAFRRMAGGPGYMAIVADAERALGRPERAIEMSRSEEASRLEPAEHIELRIVAAGARRDMGEIDASVVGLQIPELDPERQEPWSARLFYAYADNLLAAGRVQESFTWFVHSANADDEGETDAPERLDELVDTLGGAEAAEELVPGSGAGTGADAAETEQDTEPATGHDPGDAGVARGGGERPQ